MCKEVCSPLQNGLSWARIHTQNEPERNKLQEYLATHLIIRRLTIWSTEFVLTQIKQQNQDEIFGR